MINNLITLIPEALREKPFYVKIIEILTHILDEREEDFNDILNKFRDFDQLHEEALKSLIQEFGYDYITDILTFTVDEIRTLSAFLYLIHSLKGHKQGLDLVMRLLNIDYTVVEWWEKSPTGTVDTFDFTGSLDLTEITYEEATLIINVKLKVFVRAYVYPIYELWDVVAYTRVNSTVPKVGVYATAGVEVYIAPL